MTSYEAIKLACVARGIEGVVFASANDAVSVQNDLSIIAVASSIQDIEDYADAVIAEAEASAEGLGKASSKLEGIVKQAGESVATDNKIFSAIKALIKRIIARADKLVKNPKVKKGVKVAAALSAVTAAMKISAVIVKFIESKIKTAKKDSLKKDEAKLKTKLDSIQAQLKALEDCKEELQKIKD
jgi:ElaB/YqjD/DUF883 family membrane-anchored ribosome-binding protein